MSKFLLFLLFLVALYVSQTTFANSNVCTLPPEFSVRYNDGMQPWHQVTLENETFLIGGKGERFPKNMDHLAVQRGLIHCAQTVSKCFANLKIQSAAEFVVDFQLTPVGEAAMASNFKFKGANTPSKEMERCLTKIWSETQFGLIIKEPASISMPVRITSASPKSK